MTEPRKELPIKHGKFYNSVLQTEFHSLRVRNNDSRKRFRIWSEAHRTSKSIDFFSLKIGLSVV